MHSTLLALYFVNYSNYYNPSGIHGFILQEVKKSNNLDIQYTYSFHVYFMELRTLTIKQGKSVFFSVHLEMHHILFWDHS